MPVLTLARFILELSLMDYETVIVKDSKLASAALYLALRMKEVGGWSKTMEFYTGKCFYIAGISDLKSPNSQIKLVSQYETTHLKTSFHQNY